VKRPAEVDSFMTANIHGRSATLLAPKPGGPVASVAIALDLRSHGWRVNLPASSEEYTGALFDGSNRWPTVTFAPHVMVLAGYGSRPRPRYAMLRPSRVADKTIHVHEESPHARYRLPVQPHRGDPAYPGAARPDIRHLA
jgi:hypothetical protein